MEGNSNPGVAILYLAVWAGITVWSYYIGKKKGRGPAGLVLGLLLGIIGVIITSCLRPERQFAQQPSFYPVQAPIQQHQPGGWWQDPSGRHELRYFDGSKWTDHVSDQGVASFDATVAS